MHDIVTTDELLTSTVMILITVVQILSGVDEDPISQRISVNDILTSTDEILITMAISPNSIIHKIRLEEVQGAACQTFVEKLFSCFRQLLNKGPLYLSFALRFPTQSRCAGSCCRAACSDIVAIEIAAQSEAYAAHWR